MRHADYFSGPFGSLDPRYRVEDVIAEPLILHRQMTGEPRGAKGVGNECENYCGRWGWMNRRWGVIRTNSPAASASVSVLPGRLH